MCVWQNPIVLTQRCLCNWLFICYVLSGLKKENKSNIILLIPFAKIRTEIKQKHVTIFMAGIIADKDVDTPGLNQ